MMRAVEDNRRVMVALTKEEEDGPARLAGQETAFFWNLMMRTIDKDNQGQLKTT